jgi:hypothetical protein
MSQRLYTQEEVDALLARREQEIVAAAEKAVMATMTKTVKPALELVAKELDIRKATITYLEGQLAKVAELVPQLSEIRAMLEARPEFVSAQLLRGRRGLGPISH